MDNGDTKKIVGVGAALLLSGGGAYGLAQSSSHSTLERIRSVEVQVEFMGTQIKDLRKALDLSHERLSAKLERLMERRRRP